MDAEVSLIPRPEEYGTILSMATAIKGTPFCPSHFRREEEIAACILKGRELGLPPMYALSHIYPVSGKMTVASEVMLALIFKAHGDDAVMWTEHSAKRACVTYKRRGWAQRQSYCYSMEEAQQAGITNKTVWQQFPAAMLRARCISAVARMAFPDVIAGMYTPEELGVEVNVEDGKEYIVEAQETQAQGVALEAVEPEVEGWTVRTPNGPTEAGAPVGPEPPAPSQEQHRRSYKGNPVIATSEEAPERPRYKGTPGPGAALADAISEKVLADEIRNYSGERLAKLGEWRALAKQYNMYEPQKVSEMSVAWLSDLLAAIRSAPRPSADDEEVATI